MAVVGYGVGFEKPLSEVHGAREFREQNPGCRRHKHE